MAPPAVAPRSVRLMAYAPVGKSGDFGTPFDAATDDGPSEGRSFILAGGLGWLYGLGCVVGPFYGVGVGLTFPGGIIAGAGGGVGIVVGCGMGAGAVWGSGRGRVAGYTVEPPMNPPFANGLPELPAALLAQLRGMDQADVIARARAQLDRAHGRVLALIGELDLSRPRLNLRGAPRGSGRAAGDAGGRAAGLAFARSSPRPRSDRWAVMRLA